MIRVRTRKRESTIARFAATIAVGVLALLAVFTGSAAANPATGVALTDAGEPMWVGGTPASGLGSELQNAGDMNGDAIPDLVTRESVALRGGWVLYTDPGRQAAKNLANLSPADGYRMRTANVGPNVYAVGDQNDDGTPDFVVSTSAGVWVVYGVADPENDLPKCDPSTETRCLDVETPEDISGNRLGYKVETGETGDSFAPPGGVTSGSFSGDGRPELAIAAPLAGGQGAVYVLRNDLGDTCPALPGLCTVTLSDLSAPDVIRIDAPGAGSPFGLSISNGHDLNQDGRDDLLVATFAGTRPASIYVIYGKDWDTSPVSTADLGPSDGFVYTAEFGTLFLTPGTAGDANGDGRTDVATMVANTSLPAPAMTMAYTSATTPSSPFEIFPMPTGQGYSVESTEDDGFSSGSRVTSIGDLNSDGFDDAIAGNQLAPVDGLSRAGWALIAFGQGPNPTSPLTLGPDLPVSSGIALFGDVANQRAGEGIAPLGDIDGDDIPDFAVSATRDAGGAGTIYLVRGRSLVAGAITGLAGEVSDAAATLGGAGSPHGRESSAYFEWGETDGYGQQTTAQSVGSGNGNVGVQAGILGLQQETTYHYRLVVENDLGLKTYGDDRTFKTRTTEVDRCEADPTLPGCSDYTGKQFCEEYPSDPICQAEPKAAHLSRLIAGSRTFRARRGGKVAVRSWITSTGTKAAGGVRVCARVPRRLARIVGKRCQRIGRLAPGRTGRGTFKIRVKRRARRGSKLTVRLVATGPGLKNRAARVRFVVR